MSTRAWIILGVVAAVVAMYVDANLLGLGLGKLNVLRPLLRPEGSRITRG